MSLTISPWSECVDSLSPDGRFRAIMSKAEEIAMGGPTGGTLVVLDNHRAGRMCAKLDWCSPSIAWSSVSSALAVPRWTSQRNQRLCIVSLPNGTIQEVLDPFRVLELHSFGEGILRGVDSPAHMPRTIEFSVE